VLISVLASWYLAILQFLRFCSVIYDSDVCLVITSDEKPVKVSVNFTRTLVMMGV